MMIKKIVLAALVACLIAPSHAEASQKTKAQLATTIQQQLPSSGQGLITAEKLRGVLQDMVDSDQQIMLVNAQTGTSYTFVAGDQGKLVTFTNSSPVSATLPQAINAFGPGYNLIAKNYGPGALTITSSGSTINGASSLILTAGQSALISAAVGNNYAAVTFLTAESIVPCANLPTLTGDITTGGSTCVTSIAAGAIVNADVNANANIAASKLQYSQSGTGGQSPTVQAQIAAGVINAKTGFGAVGDNVNDDTAEIQAALNYAATTGGNIVYLPPGNYKISSTLSIPNGVCLQGAGEGNYFSPIKTPPTQINWAGGATIMMIVGANGQGTEAYFGGCVSNLTLHGNSTATVALFVKDISTFRSENLNIQFSTVAGLYLDNTVGFHPTSVMFDRLTINQRSGTPNNAIGISIAGNASGTSGITLSTFNDTRIQHSNGSGIQINSTAGDHFIWNHLQVFRASAEAGVGFLSLCTTNCIIAGHVFIAPVITSGIRIDGVGTAYGWRVYLCDEYDMAPGIPAIYGNGAGDVSADCYTSKLNGPKRILGYYDSIRHDSMNFLGAASGVLTTADGAWAATGTITDAGVSGGAILLTTGASIGNSASILENTAFTSGVTVSMTPQMAVDWTPRGTLTNTVQRVGYFGDVSDPPNNAIFIEADTTTNANYRVRVASGGSYTNVDTGIGVVADSRKQWRIEITPSGAVTVLFRNAGNNTWGNIAAISTNVPTAPLVAGAWLKTTAAASASMRVYDFKRAFSADN